MTNTSQEREAKTREQQAFGFLKHALFLLKVAQLPNSEFKQLCNLAKQLELDDYRTTINGVDTPALMVETRRLHQLTRNELVVLCGRLDKFRVSKQGRKLRGE